MVSKQSVAASSPAPLLHRHHPPLTGKALNKRNAYAARVPSVKNWIPRSSCGRPRMNFSQGWPSPASTWTVKMLFKVVPKQLAIFFSAVMNRIIWNLSALVCIWLIRYSTLSRSVALIVSTFHSVRTVIPRYCRTQVSVLCPIARTVRLFYKLISVEPLRLILGQKNQKKRIVCSSCETNKVFINECFWSQI